MPGGKLDGHGGARYHGRSSQSPLGEMEHSHSESVRAAGATVGQRTGQHRFSALPAKPAPADILLHRLHVAWFGLPIAATRHGIQCASLALKADCDEEAVLACLLHYVGLSVNRPDQSRSVHGNYWAAFQTACRGVWE